MGGGMDSRGKWGGIDFYTKCERLVGRTAGSGTRATLGAAEASTESEREKHGVRARKPRGNHCVRARKAKGAARPREASDKQYLASRGRAATGAAKESKASEREERGQSTASERGRERCPIEKGGEKPDVRARLSRYQPTHTEQQLLCYLQSSGRRASPRTRSRGARTRIRTRSRGPSGELGQRRGRPGGLARADLAAGRGQHPSR